MVLNIASQEKCTGSTKLLKLLNLSNILQSKLNYRSRQTALDTAHNLQSPKFIDYIFVSNLGGESHTKIHVNSGQKVIRVN